MSHVYLRSTTPTPQPDTPSESPVKPQTNPPSLPEKSETKEHQSVPEETETASKPIKPIVKKAEPTLEASREKRELPNDQSATPKTCSQESLPLETFRQNGETFYKFQFQMTVSEELAGLYQLYFHNCLQSIGERSRHRGWSFIDLDMFIEERNIENYLSADEIPLPQIYFIFSVIFLLLGIIWFYTLQSKQSETFKIHYLMGVVVFVKSAALFFHAVNYHFIAKEGTQVEAWAILYYITHFMKGALLFFTIVLIGTGWHFVKHILTEKDKNIFMFVISLQVIANVLNILLEESEEGTVFYMFGKQIFIIVDLTCCAAIMFPIIASIQHLHQASRTDGKAALNLKKMQLFRRYYIFVVVYIYFSRMIVYLVAYMVPYNYLWIEEFLQQLAILVFFLATGYSFQPTGNNPYHSLLQDEYEMDEEVLFIQPSTFTEAKKLHRELESSSDKNTLINLSYEFD